MWENWLILFGTQINQINQINQIDQIDRIIKLYVDRNANTINSETPHSYNSLPAIVVVGGVDHIP